MNYVIANSPIAEGSSTSIRPSLGGLQVFARLWAGFNYRSADVSVSLNGIVSRPSVIFIFSTKRPRLGRLSNIYQYRSTPMSYHINRGTIAFSELGDRFLDDPEFREACRSPLQRYQHQHEEVLNPKPRFRGIIKAPRCKKAKPHRRKKKRTN